MRLCCGVSSNRCRWIAFNRSEVDVLRSIASCPCTHFCEQVLQEASEVGIPTVSCCWYIISSSFAIRDSISDGLGWMYNGGGEVECNAIAVSR